MVFLYNSGIKLLYAIAWLGALLGKRKAREWIRGQRSVFSELQELRPAEGKSVWFHFASLGEFEQGRPVLERIKAKEPERPIVVSFFSPSGYSVRKNYPLAGKVVYLPLDTESNARRFIGHIDPAYAVFTKYEYWHHFYRELKRRNIPLFVISAVFRHDQIFFKWYGKFFRKILACVTCFFVQNQASSDLLAGIGFSNSLLSGDTRYDRVIENAQSPQDFPGIARFTVGAPCLIAGSTWPGEENLLAGY
ncbi:MAG TPA: glycosyltransferase N-terminal domain-containing protein, partial [Anseongella sp.]|nr:glycosyltransferase N-terminal domain-containing protein [Anseongella sp.]